jgi:hypothetical protein
MSGFGRKWSRHVWRYCHRTCLERRRRTMKIFSQGSQCHDRDFNQAPSRIQARIVTAWARSLVHTYEYLCKASWTVCNSVILHYINSITYRLFPHWKKWIIILWLSRCSDGLDSRVSIPARCKIVLHSVETGSGAHPASSPVVIGDYSDWG